ncbi:MAG: hypothetical protein NVS2B7_17930 [Herpetosiphon sp.]
MQIDHVLRGDDLLPSTGRQIWLHRQFGWQPPSFAHVPLLVDPAGRRLSKRHGALAIAALRDRGVPAARIIGQLGYWAGMLPKGQAVHPTDLIGLLNLRHLPRGPVIIDPLALCSD